MENHKVIIVVPDEGYSESIYSKAIKVYKKLAREGLLPMILVTGASRNPSEMGAYGLKKILENFLAIVPVQSQIERMKAAGIPPRDIFHERFSKNTRENAIKTFEIIRAYAKRTELIYIVGSVEGMLRKYLTFKKAGADFSSSIPIKMIPVFSVFPVKLAIARMLLVPSEFLRIWKYHKRGHL